MRRRTAVISVLVLFVAVLAVIAPYLVGMRVESLFRQHVARLSDRTQLPIEVVQYKRGWLHAQAMTRIQLPHGHDVELQHHITHGPYAVFGWARIESASVNKSNKLLKHFFGDKPAATVDTQFGYGGSVALDLSSPSFNKPAPHEQDVTVTWKGATAHIRYNGSKLRMHVSVPGFHVNADDGEMRVRGLEMKGTGSLLPAEDAGTSEWGGEAHASLQRFLFHAPKQAHHIAFSVKWDAEAGLDKAGKYGVDARLEMVDAVFGLPLRGRHKPLMFDDGTLHFNVQGIATKPLGKVVHQFRALNRQDDTNPGRDRRRTIALLKKELPALLTRDAEVAVEIPALKSSLGSLELSGNATFDHAQIEDTESRNLINLASRTEMNLQFTSGKPLLKRIMSKRPYRLRMLVADRVLVPRDDRYTLKAHFGAQGLTLNGRSVSHPQ